MLKNSAKTIQLSLPQAAITIILILTSDGEVELMEDYS